MSISWVATGSPSFPFTRYYFPESSVTSSNQVCIFPMLGNRIGLLYLSGRKKSKDGSCMRVSFPMVGKGSEGGKPSCVSKEGLGL